MDKIAHLKHARVTTYRLAYRNYSITLCEPCEATYPHPLGQVEHGSRWGYCDMCCDRFEAAEQAEIIS